MSTAHKAADTMDIPVKHYAIDFDILDVLSDGRNVPIIIADRLDNNRNYISDRLRDLASYGMVRKVSEEHSVGLYEITDLGRTALEHRDIWDEDRDEYRDVIESHAES